MSLRFNDPVDREGIILDTLFQLPSLCKRMRFAVDVLWTFCTTSRYKSDAWRLILVH